MQASILHVDADAFFASVEQLLEPKYRNKPLIVGGGHRGVVASASYEARKFGIHSAMPIFKARRLCPQAIIVKGDHHLYAEFSRKMLAIFNQYTPTVEMTSIDEGYLDLAGTERMHGASLPEIVMRVLKEVNESLGITISGCLSTSKLVSKIGSSHFKPRKLSWIMEGYEARFLAPLPLRAMPGIGEKSLPKFERLGLKTLGDLAQLPFNVAWDYFGGYGITMWERAQGIDSRPVSPHAYQRKSISEENTFPMDIDSQGILIQESTKMLKKMCFRLRKKNIYAKTITVKIRYSNFQTFTHQKTLDQASNSESDFFDALKSLLKKRDTSRRVRLIGVGLSNLQNLMQLELFNSKDGVSKVGKSHLESKLDSLREKYGVDVI
jgi:DNA polymerase IV